MTVRAPVVLLPACNRMLDTDAFHIVGHEYTAAVRLAGGLPLVVPSAHEADFDTLLDLADGVLLTGSPSNIDPQHYGQAVRDPHLPLDATRDRWTLLLIPRAVARGVPLLAICRGLQEMNVAYGGTLHQAVHAVPGCLDHRDDGTLPVDARYAPVHRCRIVPGGVLERIVGSDTIAVNSLHGQGIARIADALRIEALAPDGLIEACSVREAPAFALAVQWHPEWHVERDPVSSRLFDAFGQACIARCNRRGHSA